MDSAFVSPIAVPRHRVQQSVCQRPPAITANAGEESGASWQNTPNYNTLGTGIQSKGMQTIEFFIRPNGVIEEKVTGVRGKQCQKLTEKIEEALGTVVDVQHTGEFYENVEELAEKNIERDGTGQSSSWPGGEGYPTW